MNISKICRTGYNNIITKFRPAHSVAASSPDSQIEVLKKQDPKVSKDVTGITVLSVENYSPVTHISVLVKAGSRYEDGTNPGIVHALRNCAILSSNKHTAFAMTRRVEFCGAKIGVSSTREYMMYSLHCTRDDVDTTLPVLAEIISEPAFKPWEVMDACPRMHIDLALYENNPEARLIEALHKVAFRGGLNNSLYSPTFMVEKFNAEMLRKYFKKQFVSENAVVGGLGISHDHLENSVAKMLNLSIDSSAVVTPAKFGGGELRIEDDLGFTRTAIVAEGASLANVKEMLCFGVLQCILGIGPRTKFSCGENSRLGAAAAKATNHPFSVSSINVSYSDIGMFGIYIAGHPDQMRDIVKSVVTQMRDVTKKISEEDIKNAKHALKAKMFLEMETSRDQVENMVIQGAVYGHLQSPKELENLIDSLTINDINAVASKLMKTKPAMASVGLLHNTPYLDEVI